MEVGCEGEEKETEENMSERRGGDGAGWQFGGGGGRDME